jgi:subtilase family serine protease
MKSTGLSLTVLSASIAAAMLAGCSAETQAEFESRRSDTTSYMVAGITETNPDNTTGSVENAPTFHRLPVTLDAPLAEQGDTPLEVDVGKELAGITTKALTDEGLVTALKDDVQPMAAAKRKAVVYNPQQIRTAYGLPPVPTNINGLTPEVRASLGAGQTIYIVDAYHNPNAFKDLNLFSTAFNLPTCTQVTIPTTATTLPPLKDTDNCQFSYVYPIGAGRMGATPPAYNALWAQEIALDVQWAHAIAPLARIVLIEVPTSALNAMDAGVLLANALGPGVVSMSYGTADNAVLVRQSEHVFAGKNMTYIAAAGDSGMQANWPAMSPSVISVGGTTLNNYAVTGTNVTRNETVWSGSGGGYSVSSAKPVWQKNIKTPNPGLTAANATVPKAPARVGNDVTYNADPWTGQYVAITNPKNNKTSWYSFGGTSIGAPQWAGIVAVANAKRALKKLAPLGKFSPRLYQEFGPGLGAFGGSFMDVNTGANGKCTWCSGAPGFDSPSGWGSPNVKILETLSTN